MEAWGPRSCLLGPVGSTAWKPQVSLNTQPRSRQPRHCRPSRTSPLLVKPAHPQLLGPQHTHPGFLPPLTLSSAPGGLAWGGVQETVYALGRENQVVSGSAVIGSCCLRAPSPIVSSGLKSRNKSQSNPRQPFISSARNSCSGRSVTLWPRLRYGGPWPHCGLHSPRAHIPGVERGTSRLGERWQSAGLATGQPQLGAWGRPFLSSDVR